MFFLLDTGLQGREDPRRVLWEMSAYGLHHSAEGRTDHDLEGGSQLNSGISFVSTPGFLFGDLFFKKERLILISFRFCKEKMDNF